MTASEIPQRELRERILAAVREAKKPVTVKALAKLVKAKEEVVREALSAAAGENQLHRWPDFRRSQYFWHVSAEQKAQEALLAVASVQALSKTNLGKAAAKTVPGFKPKSVEALVPALLGEKQLQAIPAFSGSSKLLVRPGHPEAYFSAARSFMEKKFRSAGFDPADFFGGKSSPHEKLAEVPVDAAALILEAVRSLEPVRGVPVSTLRLRSHLSNLAKQEFDSAALDLRKRQEVFLSQHADPYNLSEEDQSVLIDGQDGTYYVAIAIR